MRIMVKKAKHCYLHIGAEKTGSTSIQAFLQSNRDTLKRKGYLFPEAVGDSNQVALAACAQEDCTFHRLMECVGVRDERELSAFRREIQKSLAAEIHANDLPNLILSNEHCQSRIDTPQKAQRLAELVHSVAEQVTVIFYIRRQDLAATSLYSTALKVGQWRKRPVMPMDGDLPITFDYAKTCRLYADAFGPDSLCIRVYAPKRLVGGDAVTDFRHALSLPESINWCQPPVKNKSIGRLGSRFLRAFNETRHSKYGGRSEHYRLSLVKALEGEFGGEGVKPSRSLAESFYDRFREGNEEIRRLYLPERKLPIFWEDFSGYPELESDWMPTVEKALEIGIDLFVAQQREIDRLKTELENQQSKAAAAAINQSKKPNLFARFLGKPFLTSS